MDATRASLPLDGPRQHGSQDATNLAHETRDPGRQSNARTIPVDIFYRTIDDGERNSSR
jgi:hypothetical protein